MEHSVESRIATRLRQTMRDYEIPSIGLAIFDSRTILVKIVTGRLRMDGEEEITLRSKFHLGSNTKAMTATVLASLIEDGKLSWDSKPIDVFPEIAGTIHDSYKKITLRQLLNHTAGIPPFTDDNEFNVIPALTGTAEQQRYQFAREILSKEPFKVPGGKPEYSNAGYAIAAAMAERICGKSWEQLIKELLFDRLSLDAGFGWPASDASQPWGHIYEGQLNLSFEEFQKKKRGKLLPHPPTDSYNVKLVLAPAGNVNLSIVDFAKFAQVHLKGCRGLKTILQPETIQEMHKNVQGYGLGWHVVEKGKVKVSSHNGSVGTFYSEALVFPLRDFGIVVACNAGHANAWEGINKLMQTLFDELKNGWIDEIRPNQASEAIDAEAAPQNPPDGAACSPVNRLKRRCQAAPRSSGPFA